MTLHNTFILQIYFEHPRCHDLVQIKTEEVRVIVEKNFHLEKKSNGLLTSTRLYSLAITVRLVSLIQTAGDLKRVTVVLSGFIFLHFLSKKFFISNLNVSNFILSYETLQVNNKHKNKRSI